MIHITKYNGSHPRASPMRRFIKRLYRLTLKAGDTISVLLPDNYKAKDIKGC